MKRDVFVIHTPLHLLYAITIAQGFCAQRSAVFLLINDYASASQVKDCLTAHLPDRYTFMTIPGRISAWGKLARYFAVKPSKFFLSLSKGIFLIPQIGAVLKARWILRRTEIETLYICDDSRPDVQGIMNVCVRRGANSIFYIEDGVGAYLGPFAAPGLKFSLEWLLKLLFGRHFVTLEQHGAHPDVDGGILTCPALANSMLKGKTLRKMPSFSLSYPLTTALLGAFSTPEQVAALSQIEKAILICLPHSSIASVDFKEKMQAIIGQCPTDTAVLIKYHPRELKGNYLSLQPQERVIILDKNVPAELFSAYLGPRLQSIYSELSTILLTAKWVNSDTDLFTFEISHTDTRVLELQNLIKALGVKLVI